MKGRKSLIVFLRLTCFHLCQMSKLLVNLFMLQTKALVNAYTWTTLPLYTIAQQPWRRLRQSKSFQVHTEKRPGGKTIYSRPCQIELNNPYFGLHSFNQMVPLLDLKRKAVGIRSVLSEQIQLDEAGKPIKIDGKVLKKIKLSDQYHWHTVQEIMDRVDSLARGLEHMGVAKGEKVILFADNSLEWLLTGLALQRINAITVTLLSLLSKW